MTITTICGILLPSVPTSIYFHRKAVGDEVGLGSENQRVVKEPPNNFAQKCINAFQLLWKDFLHAYTDKYVLKWSIWWAMATCGYLQVKKSKFNLLVANFFSLVGYFIRAVVMGRNKC